MTLVAKAPPSFRQVMQWAACFNLDGTAVAACGSDVNMAMLLHWDFNAIAATASETHAKLHRAERFQTFPAKQ